jgi:hypothetical protein
MLPIISNNGDSLLIVPGEHTNHLIVPIRLKSDTFTNIELEHLLMGAHLAKKTQTFNDSIIQIDELCLVKFADINLHFVSHILQKTYSFLAIVNKITKITAIHITYLALHFKLTSYIWEQDHQFLGL